MHRNSTRQHGLDGAPGQQQRQAGELDADHGDEQAGEQGGCARLREVRGAEQQRPQRPVVDRREGDRGEQEQRLDAERRAPPGRRRSGRVHAGWTAPGREINRPRG